MKIEFTNCKIKDVGVCMDGGSIVISIIHLSQGEKTIWLMQHMISEYYEEIDKLPGRVYIDNYLVEKGSPNESGIIEFLKKEMNTNLTDVVEILQQKLDWIESDKYITFNSIKKEVKSKEHIKVFFLFHFCILHNMLRYTFQQIPQT